MPNTPPPSIDPFPPGLAHVTGDGSPYPHAVGHKFEINGRVRRFAGNTVICPVPPASPLMAALIALQDGLKVGSFARCFAFLPPSSFHMTLFEGVNDSERLTERWPTDLPLDTPLDQVTTAFRNRLDGLTLPEPFRLTPEWLSCSPRGGSVLVLAGAGEIAERALRAARDALSQRLIMTKPNHAGYRFHITLSYQIAWLSEEQADDLGRAQTILVDRFRASVPEIVIGPPVFCTFEDMTRFDPVLSLV
ncbi:MAG: DUF1868 domain-containing protein [Alphaproteobacteria bacterium]|nr:DUF1868 domain-containing protein [Alphaproteobacteria bacterium]